VSQEQLTEADIDYVCSLVIEAGRLAMSMREGVEINRKGEPDDNVTAADIALSKLISSSLSERFPADCVVSEEDSQHLFTKDSCGLSVSSDGSRDSRVWIIDPIDGTQNYILDDGQYCVMVGFMINREPYFGWVYAPTSTKLYFGGPDYGASGRRSDGKTFEYSPLEAMDPSGDARLLMGSRDRKAHPWVMNLQNVSLVKTGSIGLKVGRILDGEADVFAHLSRKLKIWDTAGPAAIALGAGLEVGVLEDGGGNLVFPLPEIMHDTTVVMGRRGALRWCHNHLCPSTTEALQ